jgi:hypothetical protein
LAKGLTSFAARRCIGRIFSTYQFIWSGKLRSLSVSPVGAASTISASYAASWWCRLTMSRPKSSSIPGSIANSSAASVLAPCHSKTVET